MEKQRIIIPTPDGGLRSSVSSILIGDNELAVAENVEFVSGRLRKRPGNANGDFTENTDSTEPRTIHNFIKTDNTEVPILYEQGPAGSYTKKIYYATVAADATWTWAALQESAADFVLQTALTPDFITVRSMLLFSNGENSDGLMYWSGSGEIGHVHTEGLGAYGVSGRFLAYWKERLVVANGYYYDSGWSGRYPSGLFFSSLLDSGSSPIDPDESGAWWEVATTFLEIAPDDGSEITALWIWKDAIFVGKKTGIWRLYGETPETLSSAKVSKVGIDSNHSLQLFRNNYIFCNKDGFYAFDGSNDAQKIDEPIKDLTSLIPSYDIESTGSLGITLDSTAEWTNYSDDGTGGGTPIADIDISDGTIYLSKTTATKRWYNETVSNTWDFDTDTGFAFRIAPTAGVDYFLSTVELWLGRNGQTSGTLNFYFKKGNATNPGGGEVLDSVTGVDVTDLALSPAWYEIDFEADAIIEADTGQYYWIVVQWTGLDTTPTWGVQDSAGATHLVMRKKIAGWDGFDDKKGSYKVYTKEYEQIGYYHTWDDDNGASKPYIDLGEAPDLWGIFSATIENYAPYSADFYIRSSTDQSAWSDWKVVYNGQQIPDDLPKRQYLDFQVRIRALGNTSGAIVDSITIRAFGESDLTTEVPAYSTIFQNKYIYSTNENTDGEYRSFVLDENGRWSIYPDQLIRGYMDYENEKWLVSIDTNTKIHKMYRGVALPDFLYDYSVNNETSTTQYYIKTDTKKYDCGFPGIIKLFRELRLAVGSIFSSTFVNGTIKYKIDDNDWVQHNFEDTNMIGDSSMIRLIFPAGTRGYYIQFEFETYHSGTAYGNPFNVKDITLDFATQKIRPLKQTTTAALTDTGYMIEE